MHPRPLCPFGLMGVLMGHKSEAMKKEMALYLMKTAFYLSLVFWLALVIADILSKLITQ